MRNPKGIEIPLEKRMGTSKFILIAMTLIFLSCAKEETTGELQEFSLTDKVVDAGERDELLGELRILRSEYSKLESQVQEKKLKVEVDDGFKFKRSEQIDFLRSSFQSLKSTANQISLKGKEILLKFAGINIVIEDQTSGLTKQALSTDKRIEIEQLVKTMDLMFEINSANLKDLPTYISYEIISDFEMNAEDAIDALKKNDKKLTKRWKRVNRKLDKGNTPDERDIKSVGDHIQKGFQIIGEAANSTFNYMSSLEDEKNKYFERENQKLKKIDDDDKAKKINNMREHLAELEMNQELYLQEEAKLNEIIASLEE